MTRDERLALLNEALAAFIDTREDDTEDALDDAYATLADHCRQRAEDAYKVLGEGHGVALWWEGLAKAGDVAREAFGKVVKRLDW